MHDRMATQALLTRLLASRWGPAVRLPAEPVPWPEVSALALRSGLGPLLYSSLQDGGNSVPEGLLDGLRQAYYRTAAQNALRYEQLGQVLRALAGTPVLLLKGAALAETLYANPALRPINDLDLAVPSSAVPTCRSALIGLGYTPTEVEPRPGSQLTYRGQEAFAPPGPHLATVELHWHLLDLPYYFHKVPMDWFWSHSQAGEAAGQQFSLLTPEANVLYLAAHLALHHRFEGLLWWADLALLFAQPQSELDWDRLLNTARAFHLLAALRETIVRLARLWAELVSPSLLDRLTALPTSPSEERILRLLTAWPRTPLLDFYTDLVCLPGPAARLRFAWSQAFPQPAYMRNRYRVNANWQLPYWYGARLATGLAKASRTLLQVRSLERGPRGQQPST